MEKNKTDIHFEPTPNPKSMKFISSQPISKETLNIEDPLKAGRSPLAQKLFGFPWTQSVFIGKNFITVTKQDWVDWDTIAPPLCDLIKEHIETGQEVLNPEASTPESDSADDSPDVIQIKQIIDSEIRPAVAMDGGDIVFHKYEDNIVYLFMQGACSGCPSSTMTLKMGIEQRLKEVVPEIKEVVSM